jgi:hypothetical protein
VISADRDCQQLGSCSYLRLQDHPDCRAGLTRNPDVKRPCRTYFHGFCEHWFRRLLNMLRRQIRIDAAVRRANPRPALYSRLASNSLPAATNKHIGLASLTEQGEELRAAIEMVRGIRLPPPDPVTVELERQHQSQSSVEEAPRRIATHAAGFCLVTWSRHGSGVKRSRGVANGSDHRLRFISHMDRLKAEVICA